jgi:Surfeit locus protein 6
MVEIEILEEYVDMATSSKSDTAETATTTAEINKKQRPDDRNKLISKLEHSLERELLLHNEYFDQLVNTIPMLSLMQTNNSNSENRDTDILNNSKYHKMKSNPLSGTNVTTKEGRKVANKLAKRRKLNPPTTTNLDQVDVATATSSIVPHDNDDLPSLLKIGDLPNASTTSLSNGNHQTVPVTPPSSTPDTNSNVSRIEALRIKLQNAIASKQQRQGVSVTNPIDCSEQISKRAARRAEKNRRRDEAKQKHALSSAHNNHTSTMITSYTIAPETNGATATTPAAANTASMDIQNIDYGRLTGLDAMSTRKGTTKETRDMLQKMTSNKKNLHRLLADAERKKEQLEQLQNSSDQKDKEKAQNIQWTEAFKEADGVRIKNDPTKIKKALKRKEAKKKKSTKAWQSRTEQVQSKQSERQQIRQHNVVARKLGGSTAANLSKKKIKDTPKDASNSSTAGRRNSRPGFEGRRNDFLNSPKMAHASNGKATNNK